MKTIILATALFLSASAQAQDAAKGREKFVTCAACPGSSGGGGAGPKLAVAICRRI
jgi:cytochrome c2